MQRVEHRPAREMLQNRRVFLISFVQVFKGPILIPESGVNDRKVVRRDVTLLRQLVLLVEYLQRFTTFACCGVGICQYRVRIPSLWRILSRDDLLHLGDGFLIHSLSDISLSKLKVTESLSAFSRLKIQLNRFVVLALV